MSKSYIRLYNVFTDDCEYRLIPRLLYFYSLLATMKSVFTGYTLTTLSLICHSQDVFKGDNENRNVNECKSIISSLVDSKVIQLESNSTIKAHTPLKITFPVFDKGFEDIKLDVWESINSPDELMVITMLKRIPGFEKSKDQWSKFLGYSSKNTGNKIITLMEIDEKIHCIEGNLYTDAQGRIKQYPTKWYLGKKPEEKKEVLTPDIIIADESTTVPDELGINWGNWNTSGNLNLDDYIIYFQQQHIEEFMNIADAKLKRITKDGTNDKAVYAIGKSMDEAERYVAKLNHEAASKQQEIDNREAFANREGKLLFKDRKHNLHAVEIETIKGMTARQFCENYVSLVEYVDEFGKAYSVDLWDDYGIFDSCSVPTKEKVYQEFIAMFEATGKIDVNELKDYRKTIVKENNKDLPYGVEHEGDDIVYDGNGGSDNVSLRNRKFQYRRDEEKRLKQTEQKNEQEPWELFDDEESPIIKSNEPIDLDKLFA